jgi:hypothetical protein
MGSIIGSIDPNESALLVSLVAIALSDGLTADEKTSFGAFVAAVGDTIALIGAQELLISGNPGNGSGPSGGI